MPLMRAQQREGFEVHLACAEGPDLAPVQAEGIQTHPIDFRRSFDVIAHRRSYAQLTKLLREDDFTVVHAHTPVAAMLTRPAARRAGVPVVLYTAHGFYFHEGMRPWTRWAHIQIERFCQRFADFLFTQSEEDWATALRTGIAPPKRALAIGNGVEVARFAPQQWDPPQLKQLRESLGLSKGPVVTVIGRLVREKGYFELLDAFAKVIEQIPDASLLAIGSQLSSDHDGAGEAIRQKAAALGINENVIFAGLRDDVPQLLALSDVFCLPSWREGMPRSIIEAMAAGLPVVATDIRGCREEVIEGETGRLVPVRDANALSEALVGLLNDESRRRQMGQAGQTRARQLYDEQVVIEKQQSCLARIFREKDLSWPLPR